MAIDNTPPRLRLIATIAFIVIVTLIGLDFVFKSYYAYMSDEAVREKMAPRLDLANQHAAEAKAFGAAKLPLDQAMAQLAKGGRPEEITPIPSEDMAPMTGWSKMPKALPYPQPHAVGTPGSDPTDHAADAGALASDGGEALHTAAGDAGAPAHPAADGGAAPHAPGPHPTTNPTTAPAPHPVAADAGAPQPKH